MKQKTRKNIAKRFHITKNKKILHRIAGQDHFNARAPGKSVRNKRKDKTISESYSRTIRKAIN